MQSITDVTDFLESCIDYIGLAFHPDTDFAEYIDNRDDVRLFSETQAEIFNTKLKACFFFCEDNNIDIYELCLSFI